MNKVAIVTGSARGLGEAMAERLASMHYDVVINYVSDASEKKALMLVKRLMEQYGIQAISVQADVSVYEECEKLVSTVIRTFGERVDVLVNNAGITNNIRFIEMHESAYRRVIEVDLCSVFHMCRVCLPYMLKQGGKIINISSVGGLTGVKNQADYCGAKAGVIGFSRALALEYAECGILVNCIAPGMMLTDMLKGVNQDEVNSLAKEIPLGRIGEPDDVAEALEYIVRADYLTGQVISPNGGFVLS